MTPKEALAVLAAAFLDDKAPSPPTVQVYARMLADIPGDVMEAAVAHLLAHHEKFLPTIAQIRRAALAVAGALPPSAEEVLALVRQADVSVPVCRRDGTYAYTERYWEWPPGMSPRTLQLIQRTLEKMGEPYAPDGEKIFGWEKDFQAVYETVAQVIMDAVDFSRLALPEAIPRALTEGPEIREQRRGFETHLSRGDRDV